jgi:WhiB family redox-sensing transcriptional regulator
VNLEWMTDAACLDGAISDFVPDDRDYRAAGRAKQVCAGCPVRKPCLAYGESDPTTRRHGVYGGLSPAERSRLRRGKVA